jgi:hypothetical protein
MTGLRICTPFLRFWRLHPHLFGGAAWRAWLGECGR